MTTYGPTSDGWVTKPTATVLSELDSGLKGILGDSAGTEPDGTIPLTALAGQQKATLTEGFAAMWDLLQAAVAAVNPAQANDAQLDIICSLTGTTRDAERFSSATITCTGTPLTVLTAGRVVKTSDTGARFDSLAPGTITALSAWLGTHSYIIGDRVTNASRCYQCITAGTSAGAGGPSTTASDITDNTVHWKYLGEGTGAVDVVFEAEVAGPIGALAGKLTSIATPISGWSTAKNLLDASVGASEETNPALRVRRDAELSGQGGSVPDAIRAKILKVNEGSQDPNHAPPVTCTVFYNDTDSTNGDGLPPHSVEVLVQGGTDADIAQAVWDAVGVGTYKYGNQTSTVTDSQGNPQTVRWSRPTQVSMYFTATVYYDAAQWPANSDPIVAQAALSALLTYAESIQIGLDQRVLPLGGAIVRGPSKTDDTGAATIPAPDGSDPAPGILDVTPIYIGTSPGPASSTPISISSRQIAVYDSSRCTITATSETP